MNILKKHPAIFLGLGVTILFLLLNLSRIDFFNSLELRFYDIQMGLRDIPKNSEDIVIVDIDNDSIDKLGRWPWARSRIAEGINKINAAGPKIIGLNIIYSEKEESSGLEQLEKIIEMVEASASKDPVLLRNMKKTLEDMDNDKKLQEALNASGNIILPVFFKDPRHSSENKAETNPDLIARAIAVPNIENANTPGGVPLATDINMPIPDFLKASNGIGHVNMTYDADGKIRKDMLLYQYGSMYIPSFPLRLAAAYIDVSSELIRADIGKNLNLADEITIPLTSGSQMLVSFKGKPGSFKSFSFYDVVKDKIPPDAFQEAFKGKIVLITPSASGIMNPISTPVSPQMDTGEFTANTIWTVLNRQFIVKPAWDQISSIVMILTAGILIAFVLPRLKAIVGGLVFISSLVLLAGVSYYLFTSKGMWIQIACPLLQLVLGYIGVVTINFFVTEVVKEKVEGESAETNRMLGLSFQSQGMLDMAFDKFRKVQVDDETKDLLYNLALDYERKRQYNKAASVYEYIESHDPEYKNVREKKLKLLHASETMVFGADSLLGSTSGGDPLLAGGSDTRPTLGRYEIIKQLGKGAMGIVYLGQDPRINRTTAIKTFKFTEDFEPEEAEKMKQKFFREAESAGTLSHPNIVTIYDAGDEHDLAYIAMEFLDGEDFQKYTKKKNLLPMRKVIDYVADIADGLDYAHGKGIVHRDIKPANIMILKSGIIKITDFGIARITATSQTQTGVVKGTPHYMSPEQITGKKVDGRSDIFSLGAMLFQLLTGELPFRGDSPAALMHQIINVRHPNAREINPKIVAPLVTIIDKALEKDLNKRYARASHMSKHLRSLGAKIDAVIAQKKKTVE